MKNQNIVMIIIILLSVVVDGSAYGFDQDDVAIHGFVSQGYLKSSDNNYLGNSKDGSYEFNEIGVNFTAPVTDNLRFGLQLFSRDLGNIGNNELIVDWGFLDYSWQDWLGFRAGKIKMPAGLYNRHRDVDMLRTSILLPQSVYNEALRDFAIAIHGASLYGAKKIRQFGYIDYEVFLGTVPIPGNSRYMNNVLDQMQYAFPAQASLFSDMDLSAMESRQMIGGMLVWHTPVKGMKISGTDVAGKVNFEITMPSPIPNQPDIVIPSEMAIDEFSIISVAYDIGVFQLSAERLLIDTTTTATNFSEMPLKFSGWYGAVSWQALDWIGLGVSYGEYYQNDRDKKGKGLEAIDIPAYYAWQKDITGSLRFNVNENFCVKLETHIIDGLTLAGLTENPPGAGEDKWYLFIAKTSLNF